MNKLNNKKGISLIVLVITIIVMIILAAAIILSLSSNGIIGKANQAKTDTNNSKLSESASLHLAEYDLLSKTGDASVDGKDAQMYVREKLLANGFTEEETEKVLVVDGGIVVSDNTQKTLIERITELKVPVGTRVSGYTLSETMYTTSGNEYHGTVQTLTPAMTLTWKYAGVDADGDVIIVADISELAEEQLMDLENWITLYGKNGVIYGPEQMNLACDKLYTTAKGKGRCLTASDVEIINNAAILRHNLTACCVLATNEIIEDEDAGKLYLLYTLMTDGSVETGYCLEAENDPESIVTESMMYLPVIEVDESVEVSYADGVLTLN